MKNVLTIAGSDSCGGAGIQADIKTMSSLGVYAMSVICAITAQNTIGVTAIQEVNRDIIKAQLEAIFTDIKVNAVKIGMVSNGDTIHTIKENLVKRKAENIVVDPVMISKSGHHLLKEEAIEELKEIISIADIVTPNIPETEVLTGIKINTQEDMEKAAYDIQKLGVKNVLIKGGHRCNDATDVLLHNNEIIVIKGKRIETLNTHGTGCTLSSAIASYLAKGIEFDAVIIFDSSQYKRESERKLFYTVCTRAMHELHLFATDGISPLMEYVAKDTYLID